MDTIGRKLLTSKFLTQSELARRIGVAPQAVQRWVSGADRPTGRNRELLSQLLGIPEEAWLTDEERRELAEAEQAAPANDGG